jgi:hypothetical protein
MSYLLIRKPILEGESICSWLFRLKQENGFVDHRTLLNAGKLCKSRNTDPDLFLSAEQQLNLANLTAVPESVVQQHTLANLEGYLVSAFARVGGTRWLLRSKRMGLAMNRTFYAVCPKCLKSDSEAYYRWYWRLALYSVCHIHGVPMMDQCLRCGVEFSIHCNRNIALNFCGHCSCALQKVASAKIDKTSVKAMQVSIDFIYNFLMQRELPIAASVAFEFVRYDGLYAVISMLCRRKIIDHLKPPGADNAIQQWLTLAKHLDSRPYETHSSIARMTVMCAALNMLEDWPNRFIAYFRSSNLLASRVLGTGMDYPYWFDKVIRENLYRPKYKVSTEEVLAAARVAQRTKKRLHKVDIERLLGVHDSTNLEEQFQYEPLTVTTVIKIIDTLDHELENTPSARAAQASAIRDAIGMLFAIAFNITVSEVCRLELADAKKKWRAFKTSAIKSPGRRDLGKLVMHLIKFGDHWLPIYLDAIRPLFRKYQLNRNEFLLTRFGKPFLGHGLHDRFVRLLTNVNYAHPQRGFRVLADIFRYGENRGRVNQRF